MPFGMFNSPHHMPKGMFLLLPIVSLSKSLEVVLLPEYAKGHVSLLYV